MPFAIILTTNRASRHLYKHTNVCMKVISSDLFLAGAAHDWRSILKEAQRQITQ